MIQPKIERAGDLNEAVNNHLERDELNTPASLEFPASLLVDNTQGDPPVVAAKVGGEGGHRGKYRQVYTEGRGRASKAADDTLRT